jgi:hypothetical protein
MDSDELKLVLDFRVAWSLFGRRGSAGFEFNFTDVITAIVPRRSRRPTA